MYLDLSKIVKFSDDIQKNRIVTEKNSIVTEIPIVRNHYKIFLSSNKGCRLHAWWSTQNHGWQLCFPLWLHAGGSDFTLYDGSNLKTSIDEMVGAWCFGCCQAQQGLPDGFLLLRFSVLFTVESLSLLYLLFISWFICSRRWCIDKLGVFHPNQTSMCLDPHLN